MLSSRNYFVEPKYLFFNPLHVVFKLLKPAQFANKKKNFFLSKSLIFDDLIETIFKDLQPYKQKVLIWAHNFLLNLLKYIFCKNKCSESDTFYYSGSATLFIILALAKVLDMLLYRVSKEAKLELEEDEYVERFKPFMMDIVYEWTKGASFLEICKMTDMFEVFFLFFFMITGTFLYCQAEMRIFIERMNKHIV